MSPIRFLVLFLLGPLLVVTACLAERTCYPVDQAPAHAGKDICLKAHVYDVVSAPDGSRYLDVCPVDAGAAACRFTVVSLAADRKDVGSLDALDGHDIQLRATVHGSEAGTYMLLSTARQLHGGSEKFRPNPELMQGFSAGSSATAFRDPAMSSHRRRSSVFTGMASATSRTAQ